MMMPTCSGASLAVEVAAQSRKSWGLTGNRPAVQRGYDVPKKVQDIPMR